MDDRLVKVFGWYDNEWGYANRTLDLGHVDVEHAEPCQARLDRVPLRLVDAYELPFGFPSGMTEEESILHLLRTQGRRWLEQAQAGPSPR